MTLREKAARIAESFAIQLRTYGIGLDESVLRDCAANAAMALDIGNEPSTESCGGLTGVASDIDDGDDDYAWERPALCELMDEEIDSVWSPAHGDRQ